MQDEHLTADECDELSRALREDSAALPSGLEKDNLLKLAESYGTLAQLKRWVYCGRRTDFLQSATTPLSSDIAQALVMISMVSI
jgi:hypothetical protein